MTTQQETLILEKREASGTGASRAIRREGFIPAILYGNKEDPELLKVDIRPIIKGMHTSGFMSKVLDLEIGGKIQEAIVRDIQLHPVTDRPIHVDFLRVSSQSLLHIHVPLEFANKTKSPGLKKGGVLNIILHEIEIVCPADKIPDRLTVDLEKLEIGDSLHSEILVLPEGAKLAHPERDNTLATVVTPTLMTETSVDASSEGTTGTPKAGS